jgi:hypothetical protein
VEQEEGKSFAERDSCLHRSAFAHAIEIILKRSRQKRGKQALRRPLCTAS